MKRFVVLVCLLGLATCGCHLHVHLGGTYVKDGEQAGRPPPIEIVIPRETEKEKPK